MTVSASDPAGMWRWLDVSLACRGRVSGPGRQIVLGRLRGLLGLHLKARLPASDYCCLFPEQGTVPPPFVPRLDGTPRAPVLTVRLIGSADRWAEPVATALQAIGREGLLSPGQRAPLIGRGGVFQAAGRLADEASVVAGRLNLETPLALSGPVFDPSAFWATIRRRADALAPWQSGPLLLPDGDTGVTDVTELALVAWSRVAHRQGGRRVPMHGWTGCIDLSADATGWVPLVRFAEAFHAGRHAAFGLGRVRLVAGDKGEGACI